MNITAIIFEEFGYKALFIIESKFLLVYIKLYTLEFKWDYEEWLDYWKDLSVFIDLG